MQMTVAGTGTKLSVPKEVTVRVLGGFSLHSGLAAQKETVSPREKALPFYSSWPFLLSVLSFLSNFFANYSGWELQGECFFIHFLLTSL